MKVAVFGLPASGKGTVCEKISKKYKLKHISSGDILREYFANSTNAKSMESNINKGGFATDEFIIKLLKNKVPSDNYLLDGFPRTMEQIDVFDLDVGILVNVTKEEAVNRMNIRSKEADRVDDNQKAFLKRLEMYENETYPVIKELEKRNKLIVINGMGSKKEVWNEVKNAMSNWVLNLPSNTDRQIMNEALTHGMNDSLPPKDTEERIL